MVIYKAANLKKISVIRKLEVVGFLHKLDVIIGQLGLSYGILYVTFEVTSARGLNWEKD